MSKESDKPIKTEIIRPTPRVVAIYISPEKGRPMEPRHEVELVTGEGIVEDRYPDRGYYSDKRIPNVERGVTLISLQAINLANKFMREHCNPGFRLSETRRNFTISMDYEGLKSLINKEFSINGVKFHGSGECTPCMRPGDLLGMDKSLQQMFIKVFAGSGGIRAKVLSSGIVSVNSELTLV